TEIPRLTTATTTPVGSRSFETRSMTPLRGTRAARALLSTAIVWLLAGFLAHPAAGATGHAFSSTITQAGGGPLGEPASLAVDQSDGRLFVTDRLEGVVDVYDSSGTFVTKIGDGSLIAAGVAVDEASGLVYVADTFANGVLVFKAS